MPHATEKGSKPPDQAAIIRHAGDFEWETIRWPGETGKKVERVRV